MTLKKIAEVKRPCVHPEHKPAGHVVLRPGVYQHTCPACGTVTTFTVRATTW
jgi:hypothetical protein